MNPIAAYWNEDTASRIRRWWSLHRTVILRLLMVAMTLDALIWLAYEFWRLLFQPGIMGAVDLGNRHTEVHRWFAGLPVYPDIRTATYPPATYALLWPFVGWLDFTSARWLWALTTVIAIAWFAILMIRESRAETKLERAFVALMLLATYPLGATVGNGQLNVHLLAALITALLILQRQTGGWPKDLLVAGLLLFALVKPNMSVPFFWIAMFRPSGWRPVLLSALGYLALTMWAASFQEARLLTLIREWAGMVSAFATEPGGYTRYANIQIWLVLSNLEAMIFPASLLLLLALGRWVYRHRRHDLWLLIGVAALATRFWSYHRWYDDLLVLFPMLTLLRIAKRGPSLDGSDIKAGLLFALSLLSMLAPGGLFLLPYPINVLYTSWETIIWIAILIFLLSQARKYLPWPHYPLGVDVR